MTRTGFACTGFFILEFMHIIFDDNNLHLALAPLTLTRPVAELRFGILTFRESWQHVLKKLTSEEIEVSYQTENYLTSKFPTAANVASGTRVMGNVKPSLEIGKAVVALKENESLYINGHLVAKKGNQIGAKIELRREDLVLVEAIWELFQKNDAAIRLDYELLTAGRTSSPISATNQAMNPSAIFIEEGAIVECAVLNANTGPIYIGKNSEIMEGSLIRGPFSMNEDAIVKMGAKIYGATSIGPHCKVGGEISNCIFQAYSNKGHDGFLGNSLVGEWCNFGADTNSSNLKNNYSPVKIHSYKTNNLEATTVQFCGVLMGDHSKTGINTMLNTATVVGVSANIFGGGFPSKYIPSFTWGGAEKSERFILEKAFEVAQNMMERRHLELSAGDKSILEHLYENMA